MMLYVAILIFFVLAALFAWFNYNRSQHIIELRSKTDFALSSENLVKIEYEAQRDLNQIASNFNKLGEKYSGVKNELSRLEVLREKHQELRGMVNVFESSISQITLITDIGKDITSSLGLHEIIMKVHKYIQSSMVVSEVHFLVHHGEEELYFVIDDNGFKRVSEISWTDDRDNVLNWCYGNNKELILQDAVKDFEQYVFKPIQLFNSKKPALSAMGIPFGFSTKQTGSVAVLSDRLNAFDQYHLDLLKSLASYIAVAIDNSNLFEELDSEKKKSDGLLLNILPGGVADELKLKGSIEPKQFGQVTVMFTDMVNFTGISETMSPTELVQEIHRNFTAFDNIISKHGLEKIKTIGDAYLAVGGMPDEDPRHALKVAAAAIDIRDYIAANKGKFQIRIGLNSGPVVAGVVGVKKYAYDIWGDTVNTAARMEQHSEGGKINISGSTYELLRNEFDCSYRGKIAAKNKGEIDMYFLSGQLSNKPS